MSEMAIFLQRSEFLAGAKSGCNSEEYAQQGTEAQQRYEEILTECSTPETAIIDVLFQRIKGHSCRNEASEQRNHCSDNGAYETASALVAVPSYPPYQIPPRSAQQQESSYYHNVIVDYHSKTGDWRT
jgi:hypothetical protein